MRFVASSTKGWASSFRRKNNSSGTNTARKFKQRRMQRTSIGEWATLEAMIDVRLAIVRKDQHHSSFSTVLPDSREESKEEMKTVFYFQPSLL